MYKYRDYIKLPIIYDKSLDVAERYKFIKKATSAKFVVAPCKVAELDGKQFNRGVSGGLVRSSITFNSMINRYVLNTVSTYQNKDKLTFVNYPSGDDKINVLLRIKP